MDWLEALLLGLVQGLTEYLPVSSSGHLELAKALLGEDAEAAGLTFDIVVHVATVLSTFVVLWSEIAWLLRGLCTPRWNDEKRYALNILVSMIPVAIVGLCFKDSVEALYADDTIKIHVVGCCLLLTALLLALTHYIKPQPRQRLSPLHAFVIGIAQACAVLPGLSRSGSTIATGLLLGNAKERLAQFSFLMVIPPILGEALLDAKHIIAPSAEYLATHQAAAAVPMPALAVGFLAAFVSGCFACKWMISLVKRCQLIWFAIYCAAVGIIALVL